MVLSTLLLLAVLFIAGLINIFFIIPTNKISQWFQILFPNFINNINASKSKNISINSAPSSSSSSPKATTKTRSKVMQRDDDELRKVFSTFDKNGDGFITKQELKESLKNIRIFMTDNEIDDIVVKFDSNGDGLIDFHEFCMLTSEMGGEDDEEEQEEEEVNLKEAFDVFDKDKDGLISVEELALVLTSLGLREGKRIQECKEMISKVDMDGDGMVNFTEFKRMMITGGKLFLPA